MNGYYLSLILAASVSLVPVNRVLADHHNWPDYRGPDHNGQSKATGLAIHWSETENITWKTPIHDKGCSTPIIFGEQIWLTTATEDGNKMYALCLDKRTGKILHDKLLFKNTKPEPLGNDLNTYASPSPVIEAGRVYCHFGTYGTACLDTRTGKTLWERRDLNCRHYRGPGSSPFVYKNLLILTYDGMDRQFTVALDTQTGKNVWITPRSTDFNDLTPDGLPRAEGDFRKAYCTPIIVNANGRDQLISLGAKTGFAYEPLTGKEIWHVNYHPCFSNASRPLFHNGLIIISTGYEQAELWAVRPDGSDDATETHVVWKQKRNIAKRSSVTAADNMIFMVADNGVGVCLDARTGKNLWRERIGGPHSASPVYADGRIYFCNELGKTAIIEAANHFKKIADNTLDEGFMASPAISGAALYLRSKTHLYRIENHQDQAQLPVNSSANR